MKHTVLPAAKLQGTVTLPPDKSISHRSALFGALHEGTSVIANYSTAADPQSTLTVLRQLGVIIETEGHTVIIHGVGRNGFKTPSAPLDCGNAGTLMRLITGIIGGCGIRATLTGDASLRSRTMKRIIDPLRRMGINIEAENGDRAPLNISRSGNITPIEFPLPIPSAQLKSCILLAGLFGQSPTRVIEHIPSRDHTERMLQLPVTRHKHRRIIESNLQTDIPCQTMQIPGDFSAASFWLVAASIHPNARLQLNNTGINPSRKAALTLLKQMGAHITVENKRIESNEPVADIRVSSARLKALDIPLEMIPNCIDELPVLMIAMLFAEGTSTIRGAEELRHKETDRIEAMANVLKAVGANFEAFEDGLKITGNPDFTFEGTTFHSFDDHRIAMSAAILALRGTTPSTIAKAECASISYPGFYDHLNALVS